MRIFDIYVYRVKQSVDYDLLFTKYKIEKATIGIGYLNFNSSKEEIYETYVSLSKAGLECKIVPLECKNPLINESKATEIAFGYFKINFPLLENIDMIIYNDDVSSWEFCIKTDGRNSIRVDKSDGHVLTRQDWITMYQEEYYLEVLMQCSIEEVENFIKTHAEKKEDMPVGQGYITNVWVFDSLSLLVKPSNRPRKHNDFEFVSNCRLFFYIPKYKIGYKKGREEMKAIIELLFQQFPISNAQMISNFDEWRIILYKKEEDVLYDQAWIQETNHMI